MKYLDGYKIFESNSNEDIMSDIDDILLELNDQGFTCKVSESLDLPPVVMRNIPKGYKLIRTHDMINIFFTKQSPGFEFDDIKETYYRIKSYLTDNEYIEDVNFEGLDFESAFKKRKDDNKKIMGAGKTTHTSVTFMKPL